MVAAVIISAIGRPLVSIIRVRILRPGSCSYDKAGTIRLFAEKVQIALMRHVNSR
jgi:hypothetical protein